MSGPRSVCLSLWKVDDTTTALLMQRFYANLLGRREGLSGAIPKAEAKAWLRGLTRSECCPGPPIRLSTKSICLYLSHNAG